MEHRRAVISEPPDMCLRRLLRIRKHSTYLNSICVLACLVRDGSNLCVFRFHRKPAARIDNSISVCIFSSIPLLYNPVREHFSRRSKAFGRRRLSNGLRIVLIQVCIHYNSCIAIDIIDQTYSFSTVQNDTPFGI